ncbi:exonuclease domain-containing protein [Peijinzhouia sedimentorum]
MALKLKNPLAIFDLETTGTNTVTDRIVEISIVKLFPNGMREVKTHKINPLIPIPIESSLIHGIYDEDVKDAPSFKMVAKSLHQYLQGADLGGFNVMKFDIPVLVEEFLRAGIDFDISQKKIVDAQRIFHIMEKRTLGAAYQFYCGKPLDGAHSAEVDTLATVDVLLAQVEKYQDQTAVDNLGNDLGKITGNVEDLHNLSTGKFVDLAGRFVYNENDEVVFNFGKHKDKLVSEVLQKESSYYEWMMRGEFPMDTKRKLTEIRLKSIQS